MAAEHIKSDINTMEDIVNKMRQIVSNDRITWETAFNQMTDMDGIFEGEAADAMINTCINPMMHIQREYEKVDELFRKILEKGREFAAIELEKERQFENV